MADVSKIKLPDGTTYNIKDTTSGYVTTSDIANKVDEFNIYRGTEIDDGIYAIDKTQLEIIQAYWGGKYMLFIAAEEDMLYPFLGMSGSTLIFGYSGTYNNTIILEGYSIYQVNDRMVASKLSSTTTIPTKVSQLTNDSGFITGYTETDPTVPSWAKASTKPTYTASEVGAIPISRTINGKALSNDITLDASDIGINPATVAPNMDGAAAVGTSNKYAREDHVHPTDTSRQADLGLTSADVKKWNDAIKYKTNEVDDGYYIRGFNFDAGNDTLDVKHGTASSIATTSIPTTLYVNAALSSAAEQMMAALSLKVNTSAVGAANGVAPLDLNSKIDSQYLPSYLIKGNTGGVFYGTCSTAAGTVAKVVECADFTADNLKAGAIIIVTFTATNSGAVANLTMNVNGTGAKHIKYINNGTLGNLSSAGYLKANTEYPFYYDGANWVAWFNVNSTYSALSEADMHTGTATTGRLITAQRLKQAVQYHAPVTSVNGSTGAVTVTEGLEPLVGTTSEITVAQVKTALEEGRDICITVNSSLDDVPLNLKFTSFNRATDRLSSGATIDFVASQTIAYVGNSWFVFTLYGGTMMGEIFSWIVVNDELATVDDLNSKADVSAIPTTTSQLTNDSDFVTQTELEEAIDSIPGGGGGGSTPTLLGQTPYKLTENTNVKLTASGSCNYTLQSDTVADFDILNGTKNNVTVYEEDEVFKIKATTGATAWYQAYIDIYVDGLTVGTTYTLVFDAVGCTNNDSTHVTVGHYILYDNSGATLVTKNATDGAKLHVRSFDATTTRVKLRWYPATNNTFSSGNSIGNVNRIYIDVDGASDHTDIVNSSGSFTDSTEIGQIAKGVTISASPTASVYKMPASSGGASLPLEGKNVVVFGDSLIGMYRGDTSATTHLATVTGATVYNVGFGGCRMSTHPSHGYAEFSMWALADAVATGTWTSQDAYASSGSDYFPEQLATLKSIDFNTVDYVVIHYGTNDFGGGVAIGASSASTDHSTLCGAARYSIEKLLGVYPKLRIFISLPVYRYWESGGTTTYAETYINSQNNKLYECVDALRDVAKEYNLPVIDGYYELGINKVNASTFLLDGTHHNAVGRKRFGQFMGSKIVASM